MQSMWWSHVRKAMDYIDMITEKAISGQSVLLLFSEQPPWENELYDTVENQLSDKNPEYRVVRLNDSDGMPENQMLEKFCRREIRTRYRLAIGAARFLAELPESTLHTSYVWVQITSDISLKAWVEFVSEYVRQMKNSRRASFILECSRISGPLRSKGLSVIDWNASIDAYDVFAYCALVSSSVRIEKTLRPYLVELASIICGTDVELAHACVENGSEFIRQPETVLRRIAQEKAQRNGDSFAVTLTPEKLQSMIWESQMRVAFSVIEKQRSYFVQKYSKKIAACLPVSDWFGNAIVDLQQVELGTLIRLVGEQRVTVSPEDYLQIDFLKNQRNSLAHLTPLSYEDLVHVLSF